jgi:uncharacterized protein YbaA (DUF1428 family)
LRSIIAAPRPSAARSRSRRSFYGNACRDSHLVPRTAQRFGGGWGARTNASTIRADLSQAGGRAPSSQLIEDNSLPYVDGFVFPVPTKKLAAYRRIATLAGKVWRDHGALDYKECIGEDLKVSMGMPFPKLVKPKAGETIAFSYILFKSRAHRDKVNAKVIQDPRLAKMMKPGAMPFDVKRMAYGGFKVIVDA